MLSESFDALHAAAESTEPSHVHPPDPPFCDDSTRHDDLFVIGKLGRP